MERDALIELLADTFEAAKDQHYGPVEVAELHRSIFFELTDSQGREFARMVLVEHTHRSTLPPLKTWNKTWKAHSSDFAMRGGDEGGEAEACGSCHFGWRYVDQSRAMVGQQIIQRCVARCDCGAGRRLSPRVAKISHVIGRDDCAGEVDPSCSFGYKWPKKELGTGGSPEKQTAPWVKEG